VVAQTNGEEDSRAATKKRGEYRSIRQPRNEYAYISKKRGVMPCAATYDRKPQVETSTLKLQIQRMMHHEAFISENFF
jgi:hypothetical protein